MELIEGKISTQNGVPDFDIFGMFGILGIFIEFLDLLIFFHFFDFLESESEKHREGEREREAQLDKNAYLQIVFPSLIMMKRIPFHEENRWSGERKRASERGAGKFLRER